MRSKILAVLLGLALGLPANSQTTAAEDDPLPSILRRVAEECGVFENNARDLIGQETLEHRELKPPPRFRPRTGEVPLEYKTLRIVSEYGFGSFQETSSGLHELRQVTAVNGKPIKDREEARKSLTLGIRSKDDAVKKAMLNELPKYGITSGVADFGQLILLFAGPRQKTFDFSITGRTMMGADTMILVSYREKEGHESLTRFEDRKAGREAMQGEIWVREGDLLPLRVTLAIRRKDGKFDRLDRVQVDYTQSSLGVLVPASVLHQDSANGVLLSENRFRYDDFKQFGSESELKFDVK